MPVYTYVHTRTRPYMQGDTHSPSHTYKVTYKHIQTNFHQYYAYATIYITTEIVISSFLMFSFFLLIIIVNCSVELVAISL